MKKTIAILLVMTMALTGVFAANSDNDTSNKTLTISTTVEQLAAFKITQAAKTSNSFADFSLMDIIETAGVDASGLDSTAFLTIANNSTTGFKVGMYAAKMSAATSTITTKIDYTVACNGASYNTATDTPETDVLVNTVAGTNAGMTVDSKALTVTLDSDSYNDAAPDTYTGIITFLIKTV